MVEIKKSINKLLKDPYWEKVIIDFIEDESGINFNLLYIMIDSRMKGIEFGFQTEQEKNTFDTIFLIVERQLKMKKLFK